MKRFSLVILFTVVLFLAVSVSVGAVKSNAKPLNNKNFAISVSESINLYGECENRYTTALQDQKDLFPGIIGKTDGSKINFKAYGAKEFYFCEDNRFFMLFDDSKKLKDCLASLSADSRILYAVQDASVYLCEETGNLSENTGSSWEAEAMEISAYADYLKGLETEQVVVAIVDSGVANLDCFSNRLVQGYDFVDNDYDTSNDSHPSSHGTFLSSIITKCTPDLPIKIMPVRVIRSVSGSLANIINGIYYAVDEGADVINISLGGKLNDCSAMDDAIDYAIRNDIAVVVCSGNEHSDTDLYCPSHIDEAIAVSAVNDKLEFASSFSNYGRSVDIVAPGVDVSGLNAKGVEKKDTGTSMSAAFGSACVAMIRLNYPELNVEQVCEVLKKGVVDLGTEGWDQYYGYGFPKLSKLINLDIKWVSGVELEDRCELVVGESQKLKYSISPSDATEQSVLWISADTNIASVADGNVIARMPGETSIAIETLDGKYKDECLVVVYPEHIDSLSIISLPHKTSYFYGESLNLEGLVLEAGYEDGSHKIIDLQNCGVSEYDSHKIGVQEISIKYDNISVSFFVSVKRTWWQEILRIISLVWIFDFFI